MKAKRFLEGHKDTVAGAIFFFLGLLMFVEAFNIKALLDTASTTSSFMPKVLGVAMMLLSAFLIIKDLGWGKKVDEGASALTAETVEDMEKLVGVISEKDDPETEEKTEDTSAQGQGKRIWISILLLAGYVFAMQEVGFLITTVVYITCQALVLTKAEYRKQYAVRWFIVAVIVAVSVFYLFRYMLTLMLPSGILG